MKNALETLIDIANIARGVGDLIALGGRENCVNSIRCAAEQFGAINDIAGAAGTIGQGIGSAVSGIASVYTLPTEPHTSIEAWSVSSTTRFNMLGKYIV